MKEGKKKGRKEEGWRKKKATTNYRSGSTVKRNRVVGMGDLLGGPAEAALVSRPPQVISHVKRFLVELPSVDTFLSHD